MMSDTTQLSEDKRLLVKKYLRGELPQAIMAKDTGTQHAKAEVANTRARVVEIQVGGSKRPFFFLHGHWQATPFFCFSLARELGPDQPFYALEPYLLDGLPVPPTIETMAAAHIQSMRAVQPTGPYLLGGWCNGGLVAYEMARQLHVAGQAVELLVLMDPMYLGAHTRRRMIRGIVSRLGDLLGRGPEQQLDWFLRLLYVCNPLHYICYPLYVLRRLRQALPWSAHDSLHLSTHDLLSWVRRQVRTRINGGAHLLGPAQERRGLARLKALVPGATALRQDYPGIFEWLDMGYRPASLYPGTITFFWPSDEPWHTISGGWRKVVQAKAAQEVEAYVVAGNQDLWRSEQLSSLAARLKMCLSQVERT